MPATDGPTTTTRCSRVIGAIKSHGMIWRRKRLLCSQDCLCGDTATVVPSLAVGDVVCSSSVSFTAEMIVGLKPAQIKANKRCQMRYRSAI